MESSATRTFKNSNLIIKSSLKLSGQAPKGNDPKSNRVFETQMLVTAGQCDKAQLACDIVERNVLMMLMLPEDPHGGLARGTLCGLVEITRFWGTKVKEKIAKLRSTKVVKVKYFNST